MNKNILMTIILATIVGAVSFYAGIKYQDGKRNTNLTQGRQATFRQVMGQNIRPVRGEILNVDDKNIVVKLADGSSKIIILSEKTIYIKTDKTSKTDLKSGEKVMVLGTQNSDGSVTAQDIQLNPLGGNLLNTGR